MINRVVLVGRMTQDPTLKYTPSGKAVATFTIAVNKFGKDEANFINCVVWDKKAESTANFTKKGSLVGVEGRIETRTYDHDTKGRQYITEVVADSVQFLDTKPKSSDEGERSRTEEKASDDPFSKDSKTIDIEDEDLPF